MKIFVGTTENCGILHGLVKGFEELGHEVTSYVEARDRFFVEYEYTFELSKMIRQSHFFKGISFLERIENRINSDAAQKVLRDKLKRDWLDYDLYVFTWKTILRDLGDLKILSALNKQIVFVFIGSDARYYAAFDQQFPNTGVKWPAYLQADDLNRKLRFIRTIELYATSIHAVPDIDGLILRPYHATYAPFYLAGEAAPPRDNYRIKVVHAPSNRNLKGTSVIIETVERLKSEGLEFDFEILENLPNVEVMRKIRGADIAIDQIFFHYPAVFSTEAMANNCAVASRIFMGNSNAVFVPPICNISKETIYPQLRRLITDREYRRSIAALGFDFVRNTNAPSIVAQSILDGLSEDTPCKFSPTFFCEIFERPNGVNIAEDVKELTRAVVQKFASKSQYQAWIPSLEKRGLA